MSEVRRGSPEEKGPRQLGAVTDTLDSSQVRAQHSQLVLRLLWRHRERSRADLARDTGLSRSTISAIVSELIESGLVQETREGISRGGRRPMLLTFDDDAYAMVGVDIGATHVGVVVTNLRAQILSYESQPFRVRTQPDATLARVRTLLDHHLKRAQIPRARVLGIGVAVPSPVLPEHPGHVLPRILPAWAGVDIRAALHEGYGVPVFVENDANLGALAETWWGAGRWAQSLAFVQIAYGVGSGLILHGRIHRGHQGTAGEIGHISLDPQGPLCVCGLQGCLNMLVGERELLERVRARAAQHRGSALAARKRPTLEHLVEASRAYDPLASEVLNYAGGVLGTAIASLLNLLSPEVVVLGGSLTQAGAALLEPLEHTVQRMSLVRRPAPGEIQVSSLGPGAVALGAATLVLESVLDDPAPLLRRARSDSAPSRRRARA